MGFLYCVSINDLMPRLPKNLKISFEKSPLPRQVLTPVEEEASPLMETLMLQEPDIDALDDVIDEMIPQFVEKDPPVVSEIFAPPEPKKPKKPPSILKVAERVELPPPPPKVAKLMKPPPLSMSLPLPLKFRCLPLPLPPFNQGEYQQLTYKNLIWTQSWSMNPFVKSGSG